MGQSCVGQHDWRALNMAHGFESHDDYIATSKILLTLGSLTVILPVGLENLTLSLKMENKGGCESII